MNPLQQLYYLQEIDREIAGGKQRLREVLQAQKGNAALEQARAQHEQSSEALKEARARQKELEFELTQLTNKRKRSEDRLYSGKVINTKELEDLQREIESLGRRRDDLEDELLEAMMTVETAQEEDEETGSTLEALEDEWAEEKASLAQEQNEVATRLNELLAQRKEQAARIDDKFLTAYEKTRSKRGTGVAVVQDGMCTACGVRASAGKVRSAQVGEMVRCGSCDRLLVML